MMGQFDMGPALEPPDISRDEAARQACTQSKQLTDRALDWAATHAWKDADLIDHIVDCFCDSDEFSTWVQDVADGEDDV